VGREIVSVTLQGLPETLARLREFPRKVQKRCLVKAVRAGVRPLLTTARKNAPRRTGLFRGSLDTKIKSYKDGAVQVGIVGQAKGRMASRGLRKGRGGISGRGDLVPVHFVENDIKPHRIPKDGRKGMLLLRLPSGHRMLVESVQHPGTKGQRPIARAAESATGEANARFAEKLTVEVEAEAAKIAAGSP
jgi:hypothetical protein